MATRKPLPDTEQATKKKPSPKQTVKELPQVGNPENTVQIGDRLIEIKPTKLKYQRNRTAYFYKAMELYPIPDILATDVGVFDPDRDGDKCLMDFLIAATDDEKLITENYDDMDTGTIEKILEIYKRLNKVDEKETARKNLEAATRALQSNKA